MAIITGTNGIDNLIGTDEDDIFYVSGGEDTLDGGAGYDTLYFSTNALPVGKLLLEISGSTYSILKDGVPDTIFGLGTVTGFEKIVIDDTVDEVFFTAVDPSIKEILCLRGNGHLSSEVVFGDYQDDFVTITRESSERGAGGTMARYDTAGTQTYQLFFDGFEGFGLGGGNDDIRADPSVTDDIDVFLGEGNDTSSLGAGDDSASGGDGIDSIVGMGGRDLLEGDAGDDALYGGTGKDNLFGGTGDDQLFGDEGDDQLNGGAGFDRMYGGMGADAITSGGGGLNGLGDYVDGGVGNDTITFGSGINRDRVYFNQSGYLNADAINGFHAFDFLGGVEDRVLLENTGFIASLAIGQIAAANFRSRPNDARALDANDYFIFNRANDALWFDPDGSGRVYSAELICDFSNDVSLTAANLLIV